MNSVAQAEAQQVAERPTIHPLYVRVTHWINALAIVIMVGS